MALRPQAALVAGTIVGIVALGGAGLAYAQEDTTTTVPDTETTTPDTTADDDASTPEKDCPHDRATDSETETDAEGSSFLS